MTDRGSSSYNAPLAAAMVCFSAVTAQYLIGRAIRDGIYLNRFDIKTLPRMMLVTSALSIVLAVANARVAARIAPSRLVPALFVASALFFVAEWAFIPQAQGLVAGLLFFSAGSDRTTTASNSTPTTTQSTSAPNAQSTPSPQTGQTAPPPAKGQ